MWWKEGKRNRKKYSFRKRSFHFVDSKFQWKYTLMITGSIFAISAICLGTPFYFIFNNYKIFIETAFVHTPELVGNLEFERNRIFWVFLSSFVAINTASFLIAVKITNSVAFPLFIIKKHLLNLTKGDFSQPEIRVRGKEDHQDLVNVYNYFYKSLQRNANQELTKIMSLEISRNAHRSRETWRDLVESKYEQLNGSSLEFEKAPSSHHAS